MFHPLSVIQNKALQISTNEAHLGEEIPLPVGKELQELAMAFNTMSKNLRFHIDNLENMVAERTAEIKTLSGLLPICASCKKIRDDKGYWKQIEGYIMAHSDAEFSHSICPECAAKYYPNLKIDGVS
jgi:HAMP domain-containing protein